jgi:hypothetical protein
MCAQQVPHNIDKSATEGPQSALERKYIQEYIESKGFSPESLSGMPKEEAQQLMREASKYASLRLAEVESRSKFRREIKAPS